jgi:hypothetical protein
MGVRWNSLLIIASQDLGAIVIGIIIGVMERLKEG